MSPKCQACPIVGECRSYEHLCRKMAEAPERYHAILDSVNRDPEQEPTPEPPSGETDALRAYLERHPCRPCH